MGTLPPSANTTRGLRRSTVLLTLASKFAIVYLIVPKIAASAPMP
jgi:hypothetical protein